MIGRLYRWWTRPKRRLAQLQRHGLTVPETELFLAVCRRGDPTPPWLADRIMAAVERARAAGERPVQ